MINRIIIVDIEKIAREAGVDVDTINEIWRQRSRSMDTLHAPAAEMNTTGTKSGRLPYNSAKQKSGFEDIPKEEFCSSNQHNPPMALYIPPGKQYRHVCPNCGNVIIMRGSQATC